MSGYDTFVLDENQYEDSFYANMADSVQIKKNIPPPAKPLEPFYSPPRHNLFAEDFYRREIERLRSQLVMFFILLIAAVVIIITQRITISTLHQLLSIIKPSTLLSSAPSI